MFEKKPFIDRLFDFVKKGIQDENKSEVIGTVLFTIEKSQDGGELIRSGYAGRLSIKHRLDMIRLLEYQIVAHDAAMYDKFLAPLGKGEFEKVWQELIEKADGIYKESLRTGKNESDK